jgi:hypothetical protein
MASAEDDRKRAWKRYGPAIDYQADQASQYAYGQRPQKPRPQSVYKSGQNVKPGYKPGDIPGKPDYQSPNGGPPPSQQGGQDYEAIVRGLVGDRPLTTETMRAIEPQLGQYPI